MVNVQHYWNKQQLTSQGYEQIRLRVNSRFGEKWGINSQYEDICKILQLLLCNRMPCYSNLKARSRHTSTTVIISVTPNYRISMMITSEMITQVVLSFFLIDSGFYFQGKKWTNHTMLYDFTSSKKSTYFWNI